jgi:hypothetical protein
MKTAFSALFGLLCMWSNPATARILESQGEANGSVDIGNEQEIGSEDYGYVSAEDLWKNGVGNYTCDK